jgi:hypothetical protein
MGGPSRVIQKQLSLGPMLHACRCASGDGYSLGSSAGSSTIPCLQRSFGGRRDLPAAGRRRLQLAASDRSFPVTTARSDAAGTPQRFSRPGRCYRSRGTLAARTAVICSHTLLSSRAYPASLRMLAVLDARIACEGEVPWGAVGEYGAGICVGESAAQCRAGPGRVFLQVGQDYPERA